MLDRNLLLGFWLQVDDVRRSTASCIYNQYYYCIRSAPAQAQVGEVSDVNRNVNIVNSPVVS